MSMNPHPNSRFWRGTLVIGLFAVVGGLSSIGLTYGGPALCTTIRLPGGMQSLSGIHVLPLILVAGLVPRFGVATLAGLIKGAVELLAGSQHGPMVLAFAGGAGLVIDLTDLVLRRRTRLLPCLAAGGLGTASNIAVLGAAASIPNFCRLPKNVPLVALIAFTSGVVFAGWLGWLLLPLLRRVGLSTGSPVDAAAPATVPAESGGNLPRT